MITRVSESTYPTGSIADRPLVAAGSQQPFFVRYFFVAMASVSFLVALTGFFPSYQAISAGEYKPHWFAHVHGAIMTSWLLLFLAQTLLAAKGHLKFHRHLGIAGAALGVAVWISMGIALFRYLFTGNFPVDHFQYDILLQGLLGMVEFGLLIAWGLVVRKKDPAAHKRLLLFATLLLLQAAIDRMQWLPGLYATAYTKFLYGDPLLLPLFIYDRVTLKRIHPSTWCGTAVVVASQLIATIFSGSPAWHRFWFDFFNSLR